MFLLAGVSLIMLPMVLVFLEYGDTTEESLYAWLSNRPLGTIITCQTVVAFGLLMILFWFFQTLAIWR